MCARTGVCAETHRRTHTHTHNEGICPVRTRPLWLAIIVAVSDTLQTASHACPGPGFTQRQAPPQGPRDEQAPQDAGLGVCAGHPPVTDAPPAPPRFRRGGRWLTDALTTLSSGTDRLSVHSWLFTKASAKQEGNRKLDARSERPRGGIFHPGRCGRSECARRLRLPVCILSPKRKACAAQ